MSSRKNDKNGSNAATTTIEYQFPQPKEHVPWAQFIYDSKNGTFFGRDTASWSRLLLFYLVFYAVLAGLFAICMQGLFATLTDKEPRWKLESSIIGTNPGLGYRPLTNETERGSIIDFDSTKPKTTQYWIELIDDFLKTYHNKSLLRNHGRNQKHCDFSTKLNKDDVCAVNLEDMGECVQEKGYGYKTQKPCIFLKLNRIFDWVPQYYDNPTDLPKDMPEDLKNHINEIASKNISQADQIWVSCKGVQSHDEDAIQNITYHPSSRGFPAYYYPFTNAEDYLSPLIAVQVMLKDKGYGQIVSVECRAWAKNIIYSGSIRDRMGSVTFQLLIDVTEK